MNAAQNAASYALCIRNPPNMRFAVFLCWGMQMSVDDVAFEKKKHHHISWRHRGELQASVSFVSGKTSSQRLTLLWDPPHQTGSWCFNS